MNLDAVSPVLEKGPNGIWASRVPTHGATAISFPESGYEECFQIEDNSFWFQHRNECISRAIAQVPFNGPFLDIGGGNGAVSLRLQADGLDVVVLEPGADGAANANRRGIRNVVCGTLEDVKFANGSFGGAGLFDVIEHVESDEKILRGAHDVLKKDGVLAVTVPAYELLWSAEDEVAGHFRRYTLRRLRNVLERTGFSVLYETYFFAPLTAPLFFVRSLRYRISKRSRTAPRSESSIQTEAAAQHVPNPIARRVMNALLAPEVARISQGRSIPFGTSCLAIARARGD